jgi:hypothetical protein
MTGSDSTTDRLAGHARSAARDDVASLADREHPIEPGHLDQNADHAGDSAVKLICGNLVEFIDQGP